MPMSNCSCNHRYICNARFARNHVERAGGAIATNDEPNQAKLLQVVDSFLTDNEATGHSGGAVYSVGLSFVNLTNVQAQRNM